MMNMNRNKTNSSGNPLSQLFWFLALLSLSLRMTSPTDSCKTLPLRFVSFNCSGVKHVIRDVRSICSHHDVVILQETWLLPKDLTFLNSIDKDFLSFGTSAVDTTTGVLIGRTYGGMAFLWRRDLDVKFNSIDYGDSRLLGLEIKIAGVSTLILNVYLPTFCHKNFHEYQDYIGRINAIVRDSESDKVMIAGDWNADPSLQYFAWLRELCQELSLEVLDTHCLPVDTFTFVSNQHAGSTSWLDHIIVSRSIMNSYVDVNVLYDNILSDHRPLSYSIDYGEIHLQSKSLDTD